MRPLLKLSLYTDKYVWYECLKTNRHSCQHSIELALNQRDFPSPSIQVQPSEEGQQNTSSHMLHCHGFTCTTVMHTLTSDSVLCVRVCSRAKGSGTGGVSCRERFGWYHRTYVHAYTKSHTYKHIRTHIPHGTPTYMVHQPSNTSHSL